MRQALANRFLACVALVLAAATANAGPVEDGLKAANAKQYDQARALWLTVPDNAQAANNLGVLYEKGLGVPRDLAQAALWYRKAANAGDAKAQNNLGVLMDRGINGVADATEAARWYAEAAKRGDRNGMNNLGVLKERGRGVPQDLPGAAQLYRQAADRGLALAQNNLGVLYGNGRGVPQSYVEAAYWFTLAAQNNNANGATNRDAAVRQLKPEEREALNRRIAQTPRAAL